MRKDEIRPNMWFEITQDLSLWRRPACQRLCIQNHLKSSITEKRQNKAKCVIWNCIRLKFMKKTSMPYTVKSLGYIKCYSSGSPRFVKSPRNSFRYNCHKICIWLRRPEIILEIRKEVTLLKMINKPIVCKF